MNKEKQIIFTPSLFLLFFFVLLPVLMLFYNSLFVNGTFTIANYQKLVTDVVFHRALTNTFTISFYVVIFTLLIGIPTAYLISRTDGRKKKLFLLLILFPLLTNAVVRSIAWMIILGYNGIASDIAVFLGIVEEPISFMYTKFAVIIGSIYIFLPLMIVSLIGVMDNIPVEIEEAAMSLGASRLKVFFSIVLPNSITGIMVGITLVLTATLTAYTTPNMLGGTKTIVLATLVRQYGTTLGKWEMVSAISIFLFVLTTIVISILNQVSAKVAGGQNEAK